MRLPSGLNAAVGERGREDELAVGAELRAHHGGRMALEWFTDGFTGLAVAQPHPRVIRRGDDAFAVRAECRAPDPTLMAFERFSDGLAGLTVP
jgi:hypothetical protein